MVMHTSFDSGILFRRTTEPAYTEPTNTYTLFGTADRLSSDHTGPHSQSMWYNTGVPSFTHSRTNSSSSTLSSLSSIVGSFPLDYQESESSLSKSITGAGANVNIKNLLLYKTEFCKSFEEKGECRYGLKCQFAHGSHELRQVPKHPKYKTQMCRTFWENGTCPYGKRCCFVHNENMLPSGIAKPASEKYQSIFETSNLPCSTQNKPFPW